MMTLRPPNWKNSLQIIQEHNISVDNLKLVYKEVIPLDMVRFIDANIYFTNVGSIFFGAGVNGSVALNSKIINSRAFH